VPAPVKITICPDGKIRAGAYVLEPSHRHYRKRRAFWRVRLDGKIITGWTFSPRLAIAAAERKSGLETVPPA
jgi:hypothetical protein